MCRYRVYEGTENQTVFLFDGYRTSYKIVTGLVVVGLILGGIFAALFEDALWLVVIPPAAALFLSLPFLPWMGETTLVFDTLNDTVKFVGGKWCNQCLEQSDVGRLSELESITEERLLNGRGNIWLKFKNGQKELFTVTTRGTREMNKKFIESIQRWWEIHRSDQPCTFEVDPRSHAQILPRRGGGTSATLVHVDVAGLTEHAIKQILVDMKMSGDSRRIQSARTIELAMQYNVASIMSTFSACVSRDVEAGPDLERMLADTAKTVLQARGVTSEPTVDADTEENNDDDIVLETHGDRIGESLSFAGAGQSHEDGDGYHRL